MAGNDQAMQGRGSGGRIEVLARAALVLCAMALAQPAAARLDLERAEVSRLENGLTLILLEDHSLPVVSTQVIYRSGSRDETAGKTGLAHFLEHLAFRASANYPNGAATDAIYDAGGEWHGYTWLDQTSYYSTMPAGGLDLLLRIEADRMARVTIDPAAIAAERGAVITEMHSYENDPASVLFDAVAAAAFQAHPYRNNTIGYESDVAALAAEDARAFYAAHYTPANAVLTIVGDFRRDEARALVRRHFASLPSRPAPVRVAAVEPPQRGERRISLAGAVSRRHFELAYPAPAASNADFPAFLVLQQLLGGGSGVSFRQNEWGTPAVAGSALHGAADDVKTWFIPTADRYLLTITGSIAPDGDPAALEREIERRLARLREQPPSAARLAAAQAALAEQLVFDVETTEDAAHQLGFFEGIGAFDMLLALPRRVAAVGADDVGRVARAYLAPELRTVGWLVPGEARAQAGLGAGNPAPAAPRAGRPPEGEVAPSPQLLRLAGGLPAIVRRSPLSPTATVQLVLTAPLEGEGLSQDWAGLGTVTRSGPAGELPALIEQAGRALAAGRTARGALSEDPRLRLEEMIAAEMRLPASEPRPVVAVVSGDVDPEAAFAALERGLGGVAPAALLSSGVRQPPAGLRTVATRIERPLAQATTGYIVPAPPPGTRDGLAWRMLLYILTHDYGGRLGDSAIRDRGIVYHIYSHYRTNGPQGWATFVTGVDPAKMDDMEAAIRGELARLAAAPPTAREVEAARRHLLGRDLSAAQSNSEIADRLARQFVETGGLRSHAELAAMLETIGTADLAAAVPAFASGTILRVEVGAAD